MMKHKQAHPYILNMPNYFKKLLDMSKYYFDIQVYPSPINLESVQDMFS
jgi:hypothetical protein